MKRCGQAGGDDRWDPDQEETQFEKIPRRPRAPLPVSSERTARAAKETPASRKARRSISQSGGFHKRRRRKIR
jgi:hypothetical protein